MYRPEPHLLVDLLDSSSSSRGPNRTKVVGTMMKRQLEGDMKSHFEAPYAKEQHTKEEEKAASFAERMKARRRFKVLKWHYAESELPFRLSDFSVTEALAPNDFGDLKTLHYIIGGCEDESRSSILNDESAIRSNRVGSIFPICWDVGARTLTYDPDLDLFAKRHDAPRRRYRHAAVLVDGNIWVIGGRDAEDNIIKEVDMYSSQHDQWHYVGDLPDHLLASDIAAFARGDYLYVAGGYKQNYEATAKTYRLHVERSYELYERNPDNKKQLVLELLANLNEPRGSIRGVMYSQYGFVAGGYSHMNNFCEPLYTTERYDIESNEWRYVDNLRNNEPRSSAALIKYDGKFLIMGGDARNDREECKALSVDGNEITLNENGGVTSSSMAVETVETYDPLDGTGAQWTFLRSDDMEGRMRFGAKSWPETSSIYIFGGMTDGPEGCNCYFASNRVLVYQPYYETDERVYWWMVAAAVGFCCLFTSCIIFFRRRRQIRRLEEAAADEEQLKMMEERDDDDEHSDDDSDPGFVVHKKAPTVNTQLEKSKEDSKQDIEDDGAVDDDEFFQNYLHHLEEKEK